MLPPRHIALSSALAAVAADPPADRAAGANADALTEDGKEMPNKLLAATAVVLSLGGFTALPAAAQDAEVDAEVDAELAAAGEAVFRRCSACHQVGPEAQNRVGPVLNEVIGRTAGTVEGFRYSNAMTEAGEGGLVWTEEEMYAYLENPRQKVPGTNMAFAGLRDSDERLAVIEYIKQEGGVHTE
jgi:cytochrome c